MDFIETLGAVVGVAVVLYAVYWIYQRVVASKETKGSGSGGGSRPGDDLPKDRK